MCSAYDGHVAAVYDSSTQRVIQELMQQKGINGHAWIGGRLDDPKISISNNARLWRWLDKGKYGC